MKRILRDFDAVMHDEMSLKAGDEVDIIGKENDWLHGLVKLKISEKKMIGNMKWSFLIESFKLQTIHNY